MRTLSFIVEHDVIKQDPFCNFNGLFPAPNQKIQAHFAFSEEWTNIPKVVAFYSMLGKEFPPRLIDEENYCMIPPEALSLPTFKLQVLGNNQGKIIPTNTMTVYQKGGKA